VTLLSALLAWLGLLLLLGLEFIAAYLPAVREAVPFIGIAMAVLVALTFMRLGGNRGLPSIFAVAGVFWLFVILGLGGLDSFTRHDLAVRPDAVTRPAR
jgi:cytochrome c oxidase subunit IV